MNIRFFLLSADKRGSTARMEKELKYVFADYLPDDGSVQSFSSIKEASASVAKAIENTHAVIFLADPDNFGDTKKMLAKAFGFRLNCDSALLGRASEELGEKDPGEDSSFAVVHAYVPKNSKVFVLGDGVYAGFAVASGDQTIIVLPMEKNRTASLIYTQVIPYINATYHTSIGSTGIKTFNSEALAEKCSQNKIKIALAGTNTASYFKEYTSLCKDLDDAINICSVTEKRGNMQPVDYVVNLSITAAEFLGCKYGVAMSNAFYTGSSPDSEKIVYFAVTNERESSIREVHSFKGEDIPSFLDRCCGDLCAFICDVLDNDADKENDNSRREKILVKKYKAAIAVLTVLIVSVAGFAAYYFTGHNYTIKDWGKSFVDFVFPGGIVFDNPDSGAEPTEAEKTTLKPAGSNETTTSVFGELSTKVYENETTEESTSEEASSEEEVTGENLG